MDQVVAVMSAFPAPGCLGDAGFFSPHLTISTKQKSTHDAGEVCGKKGIFDLPGALTNCQLALQLMADAFWKR